MFSPILRDFIYHNVKQPVGKIKTNSCTSEKSDVIVMLRLHHNVTSHLSVIKNFWDPF